MVHKYHVLFASALLCGTENRREQVKGRKDHPDKEDHEEDNHEAVAQNPLRMDRDLVLVEVVLGEEAQDGGKDHVRNDQDTTGLK